MAEAHIEPYGEITGRIGSDVEGLARACSTAVTPERWQASYLSTKGLVFVGQKRILDLDRSRPLMLLLCQRDWHTDQGPHTFDFVLCVGEHLDETMLNTAARQQMQPPVVFDRYEGMDRPPWGTAHRAPSG